MALREADEVIGVFILDPKIIENPQTGKARLTFLYSCLAELSRSFEKQGGRLVIRQGEPLKELERIMRESEAAALYFNRDYSPFAIRRDTLVERELTSQGFIVKATRDLVMFEKDEILTGNGSPYTVFTPYKRRWLEKAAQEAPARFESNFSKLRLQSPEALNLKSLPLPNFETEKYWFLPAGENEARRRLKIWAGEKAGNPENTGRLENYAETRDFPELDSTSRLSPFLKFGALSVRQCYRAALNARKQADRVAQKDGCDTWISELVWRDFYYQILWHFPHVVKGAFHKKYDTLPWENDPGKLRAWQEGRTGYPLVDAGMRQLNTEYWMHNRLRMVTASFLTKHLLQNWQSGERYFWQQLVDADLAANNGGWQWSASTGTDAQPYFRIFNPVSQSQKFDPEGNFIRRYVPELSKVPTRYIHEPWKMPRTMQEHLGCIIGRDYPAPVVEHKFARERALEVYKQIK